MVFNLFLALFILLLRCSENCQQKPLKAGSWVFFFFLAYPHFLSHLITFLYKISWAHLLLLLKAAILSRSAGSIYGRTVFTEQDLGAWCTPCYGCQCFCDLSAGQQFSITGQGFPFRGHVAMSGSPWLSQLRRWYWNLVGRGQGCW